jgi:hypothetical protein
LNGHQIGKVAAVEGYTFNLFGLDGFAKLGAGGLRRKLVGRDFYGFSRSADFELDVKGGGG